MDPCLDLLVLIGSLLSFCSPVLDYHQQLANTIPLYVQSGYMPLLCTAYTVYCAVLGKGTRTTYTAAALQYVNTFETSRTNFLVLCLCVVCVCVLGWLGRFCCCCGCSLSYTPHSSFLSSSSSSPRCWTGQRPSQFWTCILKLASFRDVLLMFQYLMVTYLGRNS
jgi:hypothetical protein